MNPWIKSGVCLLLVFCWAVVAKIETDIDSNECAYRAGQKTVQTRIKDYSKLVVWAEDHGSYVIFKTKNGDSLVYWRPPSWRKKE